MEENIINIINDFQNVNKTSTKLIMTRKKINLEYTSLINDINLFKNIIYKFDWNCRTENDTYYYIILKSMNILIGGDYLGNELMKIELNNFVLFNYYIENKKEIDYYLKILHELYICCNVEKKYKPLIIIQPKFNTYNTPDQNLFNYYLMYYITNDERELELQNIYIKDIDYNKKIKLKTNSEKINEFSILFPEIFNIFDEIYYHSILKSFKDTHIIELENNKNNKLIMYTNYQNLYIQVCVNSETVNIIDKLIYKINNSTIKTDIILYINYLDTNLLSFIKNNNILCLYIKDFISKSSILIHNNSKIDIYYDNIASNKNILEYINLINKELGDKFINNVILCFKKDYKVNKIQLKFDWNLNEYLFIYYIKDRVMSNYFSFNDFNDNKLFTLYLYSKNNLFSFEVIKNYNENISQIIEAFLNNFLLNFVPKNDTLILIKKMSLFINELEKYKEINIFFNKIFIESNEDDNDKQSLKLIEEILGKMYYELPTKEIYIVESINEILNKNIPYYLEINDFTKYTIEVKKSYLKRGYKTILPTFSVIYKKLKSLNKKPILVVLAKFIGYNINVYKININNY